MSMIRPICATADMRVTIDGWDRSLQPQRRADGADQIPRLVLVVGNRRPESPDRARPGGVAGVARDHMHVQLPHDVAERADVDLVCVGLRLEPARRLRRLLDQLCAVGRVEVCEFDEAFAPRDQNEPRPRESFISRTRQSGRSPTKSVSRDSRASSEKLMPPRLPQTDLSAGRSSPPASRRCRRAWPARRSVRAARRRRRRRSAHARAYDRSPCRSGRCRGRR